MSSLINAFEAVLDHIASTADFMSSARAPLDRDGAATSTNRWGRRAAELFRALKKPAASLRDIVCISIESSSASTSSTKDGLPVTYAYRSSDGSSYNPLAPALGKARSPYARSVPPTHAVPKHALPDPDLVFDQILRRREFVPHPGGISSLFFAFADLVIHSIFDTDHHNPTQNNASSYLDLSILYGSSDSEVNQVRRKDGTGKLWDDVFSDARLLLMPPATYYVGAILGLVVDGSAWRLDPLMNMRESDHSVSPRGKGNVVAIEFNLMYRWHATLSKQDEQWTEQELKNFFQGKDLTKVTPQDFVQVAHKALIPEKDVKGRTFGGLQRQPDGRFKDDDLARIIQDATEWRAAAYSSGCPEALRVIEILTIQQSRTAWG
ncbi:hypothetical protein C0989_000835, partial [Termitomyces sp. Mn162]